MTPQDDLVLPSQETLQHARSTLLTSLPARGIGYEQAQRHLTEDIAPGFNGNSKSSRYYGFVTGGATPIATFADKLAVEEDQNVQVHLPNETVATNVEDAALRLLCDLLGFEASDWPHRTFTTGATASNIVGLACGREHVVSEAAKRLGKEEASIASIGLLAATQKANVQHIQILTTVPHSSLRKAASILSLGHASVVDVSEPSLPHRFSHETLEKALATPNTASIIAISASEVNTGLFATTGHRELSALRAIADKHHAWIHVDAAFGLQARILPSSDPQYSTLLSGVAGLELADSITGDAHKLLNVPYDCGFILSKNLTLAQQVFQNPNAAYLNPSGIEASIPSPLHIGLENSRRFRALPVYASLAAHGRAGYLDILQRQIQLSRKIAAHIAEHPSYELLPQQQTTSTIEERLSRIYIIVIFRARDEALNKELVKRINATRRIYLSGTQWEGKAAVRFAVANWQVDVEKDFAVVREVLEEVL